MRIIHHDERVVFSASSQIPVKSAIVPSIEKKPSVAINLKRAPLRLVQLRFQIGHVVVFVTESLRFAETDAVDDLWRDLARR